MATEIGIKATGHLCFHRACPGEIMERIERIVGSGNFITYRCSACNTEYERSADGAVGTFEQVPSSFAEDQAPWPEVDKKDAVFAT
jgi:hypothetical protein